MITSTHLAFFCLLIARSACQLISPCPEIFQYENPGPENDRWYGTVTLRSESDLNGVWLRLVFDKPTLQLGNWFGQISTTDHKEYVISNREYKLKANTPYKIRFFVKYDPEEPPPRLATFRLNAETVCKDAASTSELISPCPRLFSYEPLKPGSDRWYGVITLLSDSDLSGVWVRVILDKPAQQLGNWFAEVNTTDNVVFVIKNPNYSLKAGTPHHLRIYIKYDPNEAPPQLKSFRLNARKVCPEDHKVVQIAAPVGQVFTSSVLPSPTFNRDVASAPPDQSSYYSDFPSKDHKDKEYFQGDFAVFEKTRKERQGY